MLSGIIDILSKITLAVKNIFDNCQIETDVGTFTLWHFVIVLMIIGVVVSVYVRTGKA